MDVCYLARECGKQATGVSCDVSRHPRHPRHPRQSRVVLRALKRYGAIVADNGAPWFVSGAPAKGWNNEDLHTLQRVRGSDFEVVDTRRLPRP